MPPLLFSFQYLTFDLSSIYGDLRFDICTYIFLRAFPSAQREQSQQRRQEGNAAKAPFQGMGGRTSPIIVDANFNTAAALSAANSNNNGISKIKNGGKRRSVGTSQRMMLGRNKNKDSSNVGDDSAAAPPPIVPSNVNQKQVMDVMIDKGARTPLPPPLRPRRRHQLNICTPK